MSSRAKSPINLQNSEEVAAQRPLMIAHRGGVVAADAPENSVRAIELAAQQGYDMVELDVRWARDGVPVLFHGYGGAGMMLVDCGVNERIGHFTSSELQAIHYRGTDQTILTLNAALGLCVDYGLGVMLDMKSGRSELPPPDRQDEIRNQLAQHGLTNSVMTLAQDEAVLKLLPPQTLWPIRQRTLAEVLSNPDYPLTNRYWFDDPDSITDDELEQLQARGVLTIACLNSFRYPAHSFNNLERQDYERMARFDVDGYQIDSCYGEFFDKLTLV